MTCAPPGAEQRTRETGCADAKNRTDLGGIVGGYGMRGRFDRPIWFTAAAGLSCLLAACGGGSGGNSSGTDGGGAATVTSVSATCTPTSVQTGQTSQCSASVSGTGNYSSAVTWSATGGTVTSGGVFAPSAAGTATITATSAQDSTKSGNATVTVTAPAKTMPTVTAIPTPSSITTAQNLSVNVLVSGGAGNPTPTGSVTLTGGGYTSATATLTNAYITFVISPGALAVGTDTLTVTYTPDSSSSSIYNSTTGTTSVTVTAASSITSVSVTCAGLNVGINQTTQCSATVTGTGNYNSAVTWAVNGVNGGNNSFGTVSASGLFAAPASIPNPYTVALTATSVADTTQSATFRIIVAGSIASSSQFITAATGGTITLPDGSSATIPPGLLPADQSVTLNETSTLPQQPANEFIMGVGTALQLSFSLPILPATSATKAALAGPPFAVETTTSTTPAVTFIITEEQVPSGFSGAIGLAEINTSQNTASFAPAQYSVSGQTSSISVPSSWLQEVQVGVTSLAVSAANTAYSIFDFLPSAVLPESRCWQSQTKSWTDFTNCSSRVSGNRVLVLVHGMCSCVEATYPDLSSLLTDTAAVSPTSQAQYGLIVGFDYDWTQHLMDSGALLEAFLEKIAQLQPASIDIMAHSEGVPVSLYAYSQAPHRQMIKNIFGLAGPVLGTPIMNDGVADLLINMYYNLNPPIIPNWLTSCPASSSIHALSVTGVLQSPFVQDLQPKSTEIGQIASAVQSNFINSTSIFLFGGENSSVLGDFDDPSSVFGTTPNDGVVGLDSALAYGVSYPVYPLPPFASLFHTDLPSNPSVLQDISDIAMGNAPPALSCSATSANCQGIQNSNFTFSGTGFGSQSEQIQFYSQNSTGVVTPLTTTNLVDTNGNIAWTMAGTTLALGSYSIFSFDGSLSLPSNNVIQTVIQTSLPISVSVTPATVTLAAGATQMFTATVIGTSNTSVSWSVQEGATGGSITSQGVYTAPATGGMYHVIATSSADSATTGEATVTVSTAQTISIQPSSVTVPEQAIQTFTAVVPGGATATWSIQEGAAGGTITSTGIYTTPSNTGTYHVTATNSASPTQTATATVNVVAAVPYSVLYSFPYAFETAPLIQGSDGNFYGTNEMLAFRITSSGAFTQLAQISSSPSAPISGLVQATNGTFYGVDSQGTGSVFEMAPAGTVSTLYSFPYQSGTISGLYPWAGLTQGSDGDFYGTTYAGGNLSCSAYGYGVPAYGPYDYAPTEYIGCGTVFRMDASGNVTILHSFSGQSDGNFPQSPLIQGTDGNFYGTTSAGGAFGNGTVFRIDSAGNFQVLHSFYSVSVSGGDSPVAALLQGADGYLYGTAVCDLCSGDGNPDTGVVFRLDTEGNNFTILHTFSGTDGSFPVAPLIQGTDGNFYGTTWAGGDLTCGSYYWESGSNYPYPEFPGCGTVFKMDPSGNVTVLHTFEEPQTGDGDAPYAGLLLGKDGYLYGTTYFGGSNIYFGTVFRIGMPQ
jgi:uncharacterized repeat protein (TIGR03803 family)